MNSCQILRSLYPSSSHVAARARSALSLFSAPGLLRASCKAFGGFFSASVCRSSARYSHCQHSRTARMAATSVPLSTLLWLRCQKDAMAALHHPFVVGIAANTLPLETFQHYVAQDAYFLSAFAKAYELAQAFVANDRDAWELLEDQKAAVERELLLHGSFAKAWGVDLEKYSVPSPTTVAYTSFLLETAGAGPQAHSAPHCESLNSVARLPKTTEDSARAAEIVAAMVPCMRLYAFLGQELEKTMQLLRLKHEKHSYAEWVATYASAGFEASAKQLETLLDRLGAGGTLEANSNVLNLYRRAMELEVQFFSAQPMPEHMSCSVLLRGINASEGGHLLPAASHAFVFAADFDSTCTSEDSSALVAELAFRQESAGEDRMADGAERRQRWEDVAKGYTEGYNAVLESCLLRAGSDDSAAEAHRVRPLLDALSAFEEEANRKVEASGVLRGIRKDDLVKRGHALPLREGCARVLEGVKKAGISVNIVSVAWSARVISGSLMGVFGPHGLAGVNIQANELDFDSSGISTGKLGCSIQTAFDKEKVFKQLCRDMENIDGVHQRDSLTPGSNYVRNIKSVFIGDSVTDLLAMLCADIGIVVGSNSLLLKVLAANNIELVPLLCSSVFTAAEIPTRGGVLYKAGSWEEIGAYLGLPLAR